jgi:hypothetical protein
MVVAGGVVTGGAVVGATVEVRVVGATVLVGGGATVPLGLVVVVGLPPPTQPAVKKSPSVRTIPIRILDKRYVKVFIAVYIYNWVMSRLMVDRAPLILIA